MGVDRGPVDHAQRRDAGLAATKAIEGSRSARSLATSTPLLEEGATTCCYARSEKSWVNDPAGVAWEVFHTTGDSATYGGGPVVADARLASTPTGMAIPAIAEASPPRACGC